MANTNLASFGRPADATYFAVAAYGAALPTSAADELSSDFSGVLVSDEGVTLAPDLGSGDPVKDWAGHAVLAGATDPAFTVEVPIIDNTETAHKILYGPDATAASSTFSGDVDTWTIVITELRNDEDGAATVSARYVIPQAIPTEWDEGTHTRDEVIVHTVTFTALYDATIGGYFVEYVATETDAANETEEA